MKKLFLILILLFITSITYSQTAIPLLGYSSFEVKEKLKGDSSLKLVSQGDFSKETQTGGNTYLYYSYTKLPDVYIMYQFSNDNYATYHYEERIDDNRCYSYVIISTKKNLTSFIADVNSRCIKKTAYTWMSKDKRYQISLGKGGMIKIKDVVVILPNDLYLNLSFSPCDPDEIEFQDRISVGNRK